MDLKLLRDFFERDTVQVAKDLLGKQLVFGKYVGYIVETEAYTGQDDPASHAYKGATKRSSIMFGQAGLAYVYMIYGLHYCLNIVTERVGKAGAVLIRGMELLKPANLYLGGPGRLCQHLGITKAQNYMDLITRHDFYLQEGVSIPSFHQTPRVGIKVGTDKLWRFCVDRRPIFD